MLFTYPVAGAPDKVIALLVGMVLFVVNEANRVENQVIMQMVFIDVSCQNKLILAALYRPGKFHADFVRFFRCGFSHRKGLYQVPP